MKEVVSLHANVCAVVIDGALLPQVEVVLVLTEPVYRVGSDGSVARERLSENVRFAASPGNLRLIADELRKMAQECDDLTAGLKLTEVKG